MNKHHPHKNIIESKLEQLPAADADLLWNDMHSILDKEMPQKKERRRFIVWLFRSKGLLLLTVVFLTIIGSSLFFLSAKENSTVAIKKLPGSLQSKKFTEEVEPTIPGINNENATAAVETDQQTRNITSATVSFTGSVGHVSNNSVIQQTKKESENYTANDQFSKPVQNMTERITNFDITPVNARSVDQDLLVATNHNEEKDSVSQQPELLADKLAASGNNNKSKFYTGIISGVDLSSIHFHSAKTGASMGLIIGYNLNKRWSIETGLFWDTKKIYDNGSYFNPPGYTPTNGIKITAVNGKSRIYELPVNVKYTVIAGKHSLFTTAGLSSYFMSSENYDYEYLQNNQPGGHNYLSYKNQTKDWFSVANFSIGYTHKLGDIGSIRVEPYLKLPIKNLGIGNMPIMSTGLNVGYIKQLR